MNQPIYFGNRLFDAIFKFCAFSRELSKEFSVTFINFSDRGDISFGIISSGCRSRELLMISGSVLI